MLRTLEAVGIGGAIGTDGADGALSQSSAATGLVAETGGLVAETGGLAGTGLEALGIGGLGVDRMPGSSWRTGVYPDPCWKSNLRPYLNLLCTRDTYHWCYHVARGTSSQFGDIDLSNGRIRRPDGGDGFVLPRGFFLDGILGPRRVLHPCHDDFGTDVGLVSGLDYDVASFEELGHSFRVGIYKGDLRSMLGYEVDTIGGLTK